VSGLWRPRRHLDAHARRTRQYRAALHGNCALDLWRARPVRQPGHMRPARRL